MSPRRRNPAFPRMIEKFCRQRGAEVLPPRDVERLCLYLVELFHLGVHPPTRGGALDWVAMAEASGISDEVLRSAKDRLRPGIEALRREVDKAPARPRRFATRRPQPAPSAHNPNATLTPETPARRRGRRPTPIVEFPEPVFDEIDQPATLEAALQLQMRRHSDNPYRLTRALAHKGVEVEYSTLRMWALGLKTPDCLESLAVLRAIAARYRLPPDYFRATLDAKGTAMRGHRPSQVGPAERRRIAWHLPDDFAHRSPQEREEILTWVRSVVVSGSTDYRRFHAAASKQRFAVRFPGLQSVARDARMSVGPDEARLRPIRAPDSLAAEMAELLRFKTSTLTPLGYRRRGVWGPETASQKVEYIGLLFGALAASPSGPIRGAGVPLSDLSLALFVFPAVWDWYLRWRETRRGFFTVWEGEMLNLATALTAAETGWLTQMPALADRLSGAGGLVPETEVERARADWSAACARLHAYGPARMKEIQRVAQVHRDPFEPILAILEADSPVREYRRIADEILLRMPCERRYPKAAAEAARSFLMIRLGLHLGFRQKNLRQLLVRPRGATPSSERQLIEAKRGELRWSERDKGWEVWAPAVAFKNATSSFFAGRPFRLLLPDLGELYRHIETYISRHRVTLIGRAQDPGTFFVKSVKASSADAAYNQTTFYEAWRWIIQRYGIFNPYTGRGAIPGLLPHGPHNVRDVLATHILKQTGSYEQASYAIQDTPDMVAHHYGRFLPQDKAAIAAQVLNQVWDTA